MGKALCLYKVLLSFQQILVPMYKDVLSGPREEVARSSSQRRR